MHKNIIRHIQEATPIRDESSYSLMIKELLGFVAFVMFIVFLFCGYIVLQ
jgi:hypothetical protein